MQLKDVTPIIKEILEERDKNPLVINTERYIPCYKANQYGNAVRAGLRKALRAIEQAPVVDAVPVKIDGNTSDGYHTFNELYHHRAVLFSVIVKAFQEKAWKSRKHHDGTMFDGMFIVGIETPDGQATYHYDLEPYWDMFKCKEVEFASEWDGHTAEQTIERIGKLEPMRHGRWVKGEKEKLYYGYGMEGYYDYPERCSVCHYDATEHGCGVGNYCPNCGTKMDLEG